MRIVRFFANFFSFSLPAPAASVSDLNFEFVCSVWCVEPLLRAHKFSVVCRTPKWEPVISAKRPRPQPRSCEFKVVCRPSSIVSENLSERMTEDMSERYVIKEKQEICQKE